MSISNSDDFVNVLRNNGIEVNEHVVRGRSVQLAPGTYVADYRNGVLDSVTFSGTTRGDTLFGGGGEAFAFFMGTRGNDLYGTATRSDPFSTAYTDYSHARTGVSVNMDYHGVRTFTDAGGKIETIAIIGKANDGLGGTDYFAASAQEGHIGFSSIAGIFGSAHRDVMIGDAAFYGGGGNDFLISSSFASGGTGNDRLVGRVKEGELWICSPATRATMSSLVLRRLPTTSVVMRAMTASLPAPAETSTSMAGKVTTSCSAATTLT